MTLIGKKHARLAGYCSDGLRQHCERLGLDFKEFILRGLPEEQLAHIDNHYIKRLIEIAHKQNQEE